jgi:hypothetical protein
LRRVLLFLFTAPFVAIGFVCGIVALLARIVWAALVEGFMIAWGLMYANS